MYTYTKTYVCTYTCTLHWDGPAADMPLNSSLQHIHAFGYKYLYTYTHMYIYLYIHIHAYICMYICAVHGGGGPTADMPLNSALQVPRQSYLPRTRSQKGALVLSIYPHISLSLSLALSLSERYVILFLYIYVLCIYFRNIYISERYVSLCLACSLILSLSLSFSHFSQTTSYTKKDISNRYVGLFLRMYLSFHVYRFL